MAQAANRVDVPVTIDESKCIDGCTLCVDMCPLDSLAIHPDTGKAYMHVDECWYCGPCAALTNVAVLISARRGRRRPCRCQPPGLSLTGSSVPAARCS